MNEFCSVGDDSCLLLWDARTGYQPISKVVKAHNADLHCVDWNAHDENLILTGYLSLGFGRYEPMKTLVFHVSYCRTLWTNCV